MAIIMPEGRSSISSFDQLVGKMTGEIFSILARTDAQDHMCLLPALTFKVRSCLSNYLSLLTSPSVEIQPLARDLRSIAESTLRFFEYDQDYIDYLSPEIKSTLLIVLQQARLHVRLDV